MSCTVLHEIWPATLSCWPENFIFFLCPLDGEQFTLPSPPAVCFLSRQRAAFFVSGWKTGHHTYQFLTIRRYYFMAFFASAIDTLQILVVALGAGLGAWGVINLLEGYGNDNRATCS